MDLLLIHSDIVLEPNNSRTIFFTVLSTKLFTPLFQGLLLIHHKMDLFTILLTQSTGFNREIENYTLKKEITIMTAKEWNKNRNTFRKIYANVKAAHPDWSNARVYLAVKNKFSK